LRAVLTGLLVMALTVAVAAADDGGDVSPAAPVADAPQARLDAAIDLYLHGRPTEARSALEDLLADGRSLPPSVRQDALAFLGDILLSEEGDLAARTIFATLLAEAPLYQMDPFRHPPEVVHRFEELRREIVPPDLLLPPVHLTRDDYPWTITLPGGVYYFQQRSAVPGLTVAALQAAGLGLSVWSRIQMQGLRRTVLDPDGGIRASGDLTGVYRARYERYYALNLVSGVVGWSAYLVPITVETVRWGGSAHPSVAVGPTSVELTVPF
jgi:hypothetical protein